MPNYRRVSTGEQVWFYDGGYHLWGGKRVYKEDVVREEAWLEKQLRALLPGHLQLRVAAVQGRGTYRLRVVPAELEFLQVKVDLHAVAARLTAKGYWAEVKAREIRITPPRGQDTLTET